VKWSGNQSGVITSSAAPDAEMLRTVQAIVVAPNAIVPAFNTRLRGALRCSSMTGRSVKPDADGSLTPRRLDGTWFQINNSGAATDGAHGQMMNYGFEGAICSTRSKGRKQVLALPLIFLFPNLHRRNGDLA
jgi:hypothetical protein